MHKNEGVDKRSLSIIHGSHQALYACYKKEKNILIDQYHHQSGVEMEGGGGGGGGGYSHVLASMYHWIGYVFLGS